LFSFPFGFSSLGFLSKGKKSVNFLPLDDDGLGPKIVPLLYIYTPPPAAENIFLDTECVLGEPPSNF
jgi:hypothetical protein